MIDNIGLDYQALQEQIERQLLKEKQQMQLIFFLVSLVTYLGFFVIGWWLFLNNGGQPPMANLPGIAKAANPLGDAMTMISIAGLMPLIFQLTMLVMNTRRGEKQLRDRIAGRITQAEMKKQFEAAEALKEKPKRSVHLTDDGELEETVEPENVSEIQRRAK